MAPFLFMSKKNDFGCMFKYSDNELGYIQCTINNKDYVEFQSMGFVDNISDIKKPKKGKKNGNSNKPNQQSLVS